MTESLVKKSSVFDKVRLSQLMVLCELLTITQLKDIANIRRLFIERALAFEESLTLLKHIRVIKEQNGVLSLTKSFDLTSFSDSIFKRKLLLSLFLSKGIEFNLLDQFVSNFKNANGVSSYDPTEVEKIKYSDIRNLLLELEFIVVDTSKGYLINQEYFDLFIKRFNQRKISLESFKKKQAEQEAIGLLAEFAAIKFEKRRLSNSTIDLNKIEHTSQKNVQAGYDVKSFEIIGQVERFIEVKAVPMGTFKFYWSRAEIRMSKILGDQYYLYLIPVISNNIFDMDNLLIIKDPFSNLYENRSSWERQEESVSFWKK